MQSLKVEKDGGVDEAPSPAAWAAAIAFLLETEYNSIAALLSLPGYRYPITTCRSVPAVARGSRTVASTPVLSSTSRRQKEVLQRETSNRQKN